MTHMKKKYIDEMRGKRGEEDINGRMKKPVGVEEKKIVRCARKTCKG